MTSCTCDVCIVSSFSRVRVWIHPVWLPVLPLVISWTGKIEFFPVPVGAWDFGLARRVRLSRPASARSFSTFSLKMVLTHELLSFLLLFTTASIYHHRISVPSLPGHAIACRWRLPPRVRRHKAISPQGSWSNGCFLYSRWYPIDQVLHASLFPNSLGLNVHAQSTCCAIWTDYIMMGSERTTRLELSYSNDWLMDWILIEFSHKLTSKIQPMVTG